MKPGKKYHASFNVGDHVTVINGTFKNFEGVVETINEEKEKLGVVVQIFGRLTQVDISYEDVEKI